MDSHSNESNWNTFLARHPMLVVMGCFLALSLTLLALHRRQRQEFTKLNWEEHLFHQSQIDLVDGQLQFNNSNVPGSPFDRNQGVALVVQALHHLVTIPDALDVDPKRRQSWKDAVAGFQTSFERLKGMDALDPSSTLDLRIRFHTLNHHLSDMDKAMQDQMTRLASSHDRDFYGSLLSGLAITGIAGTILFRIRRKYDEAVESKNLANKLLQAVVEGTDDSIYVKDLEGNLLLVNDATPPLLRDMAVTAFISDGSSSTTDERRSFDESMRERIRSHERIVLEKQRSVTYELAVSTPTGLRTLLSHAFPYRSPKGTLLGLISILRDITDRILHEQEIQQKEARYRNLLEVFPDALVVCKSGVIQFSNPSAQELFLHEKSLVGAWLRNYLAPDSKLAAVMSEEQFDSNLYQEPWEEQIPTGEEESGIPVMVTLRPLKTANGSEYLLAFRDLRIQKQLEEQQRIHEMMLREAAMLASFGGWGFNPRTFESQSTPETRSIFELNEGESLRMEEAMHRFREPSRTLLRDALSQAIEQGQPYDLELELITKSQQTKWIRAICTPDIVDGKVRYIRGSIQDITERKTTLQRIQALNEELEARVAERTAELLAVNKELEAFSYSVSHDLRAPLRAIDGFSRIVLEDYAHEIRPEIHEFLVDIRRNTQQMGRLVDDLLQFSRLGRLPIDLQRVSMRALCLECWNELESSCHNTLSFELRELPDCMGDPRFLKQVWVNLLSNAIKYTSKQPKASIEVGWLNDQSDVIYFVKDDGIGFDMKYSHKLFGVFQRLHRAEDYQGTGVGLAIVQRIIERHGGKVWADAAPQQGARFFFSLKGVEGDDVGGR